MGTVALGVWRLGAGTLGTPPTTTTRDIIVRVGRGRGRAIHIGPGRRA